VIPSAHGCPQLPHFLRAVAKCSFLFCAVGGILWSQSPLGENDAYLPFEDEDTRQIDTTVDHILREFIRIVRLIRDRFMLSTTLILLIACGWLLIAGVNAAKKGTGKHGSKGKAVPKMENQSVTPWEYCEGCKVTVDLYAELALQEMRQMQMFGVKEGEVFAAEKIIHNMCDNADFNARHIPAMKFSCIKVTGDNLTDFLDPWQGAASAATMGSKGVVFDIKQEVRMVVWLRSKVVMYEISFYRVDLREQNQGM
jgi:hypothetical protein